MSVDVNRILALLTPGNVNRGVASHHDEARERFRLPSITARTAREFKYLVTTYYQHHQRYTGQGDPSEEQAFGESKRLLDNLYDEDRFQEGYNVALRQALEGSRGGMRDVLNRIADALKHNHMNKYRDHVYYEHVDPLSKADNMDLARAFFDRFGHLFAEFGVPCDEMTFAFNTRAALEYHFEVLEKIFTVGRKI